MSPFVLPAIVIAAYLVGSTPLARLLSKCESSSNPTEQRFAAFLKVAIDITKGALVVWIGSTAGSVAGLVALAGVFIGHNYPIWPNGRSGNGLGTLLGGLLALDPILGLVSLVSWILGYFVYQKAVPAALAGAVGTLGAAMLLPLAFSPVLLLPLAGIVFWRHRCPVVQVFKDDAGAKEPSAEDAADFAR